MMERRKGTERLSKQKRFGYPAATSESRRHAAFPILLFLGSMCVLASFLSASNQIALINTATATLYQPSLSLSSSSSSPDITSTSTSSSSSSFSCKRRLLQLEEQFNRRRQLRIDSMLTLNATMTKKNQRFDIFEPEANCIVEERFGSDTRYHAFGDGPKFVCGVDFIGKNKNKNNNNININNNNNNNNNDCLVYSVGSDNDIQFEKAVHTFLQCETHTFDPTLYEPFKGDEFSTFHPWGIGVDGESSRKHGHDFITKSLHTIMTELGHTDRTIDILKFDCEGCEYESMPPFFDLIASNQIRVNQIQIELHLVDYDKLVRLFMAADKARMRIFHKERNAWGCGGNRCVEYSFVSESFLKQVNGAVLCGDDEQH